MTTELVEQTQSFDPRTPAVMPGFGSQASWELANRIAKAFAASTLVPAQYRENVANCIVALEMANRLGASPLMVMQNLYVVHGTPGWSAKFLIACFNQCGRFSSIRYEWNKERTTCRAWAIERATGERIDGPHVSMQMAKEEGWSTKTGSKWKTMPDLMLMYRSATFLIRTYAPEISLGLRTDDELIDMGRADVVPPRQAKAAEIGALLSAPPQTAPAPPAPAPAFDAAAALARINDCGDREILAMIADELRDAPDDVRAELMDAYRMRDDELSLSAST